MLLVATALLISPTYYYHYSDFLAPFVALVASSVVVRLRDRICQLCSVRSFFLPGVVGLLAIPTAIALLLAAVVVQVVRAPVAPHVGDVVSDAIPVHGCVLYANPTLALLDNRFTADVSGCPDVIDWLGQERVLDGGVSATRSDSTDNRLQVIMGRWIEDSDAVVLESSNLGLNSANVDYLYKHFERRAGIPRGVRIYVRASSRHRNTDSEDAPLAVGPKSPQSHGSQTSR
jgi:hypothetical protein